MEWPLSSSLPLPASGGGEKCSAIGHFRPNGSGVGQTSGVTVHGASGSVVLGRGEPRARSPANRQTGGVTHASTGAVIRCPCRQCPCGKRTRPENQALDCAAIPPLAGFRRLVNVTALSLTIRSRASCPASVARIRSPPIWDLRNTSVWHTEVLRRYSPLALGGTASDGE